MSAAEGARSRAAATLARLRSFDQLSLDDPVRVEETLHVLLTLHHHWWAVERTVAAAAATAAAAIPFNADADADDEDATPTPDWPAWLASELGPDTLDRTITLAFGHLVPASVPAGSLSRGTERDVAQRFKTAAAALGFENQGAMFFNLGRAVPLKTASAKTIASLVNATRGAKFTGEEVLGAIRAAMYDRHGSGVDAPEPTTQDVTKAAKNLRSRPRAPTPTPAPAPAPAPASASAPVDEDEDEDEMELGRRISEVTLDDMAPIPLESPGLCSRTLEHVPLGLECVSPESPPSHHQQQQQQQQQTHGVVGRPYVALTWARGEEDGVEFIGRVDSEGLDEEEAEWVAPVAELAGRRVPPRFSRGRLAAYSLPLLTAANAGCAWIGDLAGEQQQEQQQQQQEQQQQRQQQQQQQQQEQQQQQAERTVWYGAAG
ncbi:hypothetical protein CSHISOI_01582 [Colletotrichum shisoi]|uniref:Uncharacterized protein n=1 Tax=Colletotrichum shisoi TaxID=2078593 RepID=A0A5Q4C4T8_9PEZI|nr:hypothetical protein CSHISOI_01582 [Colletotrichum shisoi]